jgi:predicted HicB family RNase H-like nuclease
MNQETNISKGDRSLKKVFTFRIDPQLKEAAKKAAREVKLTVSRYIQELIRRDLWSKGLLR